MTVKKCLGVGIAVLLSLFLIAAPSWAIAVLPGDRIELKATSPLGVPLHRIAAPSLIGRSPDGTIASVIATANEQQWIEIVLPDGNQRWIVERYISRVLSSNSNDHNGDSSSDLYDNSGNGVTDDSREVSTLRSRDEALTVAAVNVENLDPGDRDRLTPLGQIIVRNLAAPDILVLTEIQDNDGPQDSAITDATTTYNELINAIRAAGGPDYVAIDIAPQRKADGGEPGGNIRVGYLYQPVRVTLAPGIAGTATDAVAVLDGPSLSFNPGRIEPDNMAFDDSRKPLAAEFWFNQNSVFIVGNHFVSKRGGNDELRADQAVIVGDFVDQLLAKDPQARVIVAGDLNDVEGAEPIELLKVAGLTNLADLLEEGDRFTYNYRGRLQQLDYILVSSQLADQANAEFDIVHVNINRPNAVSDHDPVLARFTLSDPSTSGNSGTTVNSGSVNTEFIFPDLTGEALRSRLATDYRVRNSLGYDRARDYMYSQLDNQDGKVHGIYTDFTVFVDPNADRPRTEVFQDGNGINAEHSWPQSKGATGVAKSDLHHLFPARANVNSRRGSLPFADIDDHQTNRWLWHSDELTTIPSSNIDAYSESINSAFEPREVVKGNIARALFYFQTLYGNQATPGFFEQQLDALCQWNVADPVDKAEVLRSRAIATQQGNENPFVLDPSLANRLYCQ